MVKAALFFALAAGSVNAIAFGWPADQANWPVVDAQVTQTHITVTREAQGVENRGVLRLALRYPAAGGTTGDAQLQIPGHLKSLRALAQGRYAQGASTRVRIDPDHADRAVLADAQPWLRWVLAGVVGLCFVLCGLSALGKATAEG